MSIKHTKRIKGYKEEFRPIWHFFDIKAYCIMAVMMGGGIWLRSSGLVPDVFIAVFYKMCIRDRLLISFADSHQSLITMQKSKLMVTIRLLLTQKNARNLQ